jgi:DNA helicase-2/ATP-dependent DNA helicase PcrA
MSTPEKKRYSLRPAHHGRTTLIAYEAELNEAQWQAVRTIYGPQLVIAGAGSGKTRTLIYRVAYLIEQGIEPERILLLTFTKKAAEQMLRRAAGMLDGRCARINGGTFHGFANSILRQYADRVGYPKSFSIADRADSEDIINVVRTELGFAKQEKRFPKKRTILSILSKSINTLTPIENVVCNDYPQYIGESKAILEIAAAFIGYKQRNGIMDYDDLLVQLLALLEGHSEVRDSLSQQYQFIMVDEFQDTNFLQAEITHHLGSAHQNILAVGDDAQSIYSFRGANFRNIMEFPKRFSNCTITRLEKNYRSTEPILSFCNALMLPATEKYEKHLFSGIDSPQKPVFVETASFDEQAAFIAQHILELREEGVSLDDIAVLFRSGWHSNELEFELKARNIPFVKHGGLKFVEASHIKDLVSLLRIMHNPSDAIAWHRVLLLFEGVGSKTAQKIIAEILELGIAAISPERYKKSKFGDTMALLYALLGEYQKSPLAPTIAAEQAAKFYQPLLKSNYDDFKKRQHDIGSFTHLAERYRSLASFLDELSLHPPELSQVDAESSEEEKEKLTLSTIHSAKGLEWHTVFVLSLIDGFLPSTQCLDSLDEIEEERRLLYVACTRAKQNLFLLCPQLQHRGGGGYPFTQGLVFSQRSRFLSQVERFADLTEQWVLTADGSE